MVALSYGGPEALVGRGLAAPPQESPTVFVFDLLFAWALRAPGVPPRQIPGDAYVEVSKRNSDED